MKVRNFFVMRFERHFFWVIMAFFAFCLVGSISSFFFIGEDDVKGGKIVSISYSPFLAFLLAVSLASLSIFLIIHLLHLPMDTGLAQRSIYF